MVLLTGISQKMNIQTSMDQNKMTTNMLITMKMESATTLSKVTMTLTAHSLSWNKPKLSTSINVSTPKFLNFLQMWMNKKNFYMIA